MLVVNVTWRNRSYVGTLLDASRHDWAPPRLTDGESDSNQQPRGKTRPGRRGEKGAKGGRTRNEGVNGQRGKVGKRISPNDQENNSDGDGKPANKKPRPNPSTRVPTPDGSESNPKGSKSSSVIGGRDSPVPIGGYYVCEEADCEKKFKNLEALQYHKPKCKKVPSSKNPDSDVPKKAKLENTKSEVIKNDPDNSNNQPAANNSTDRVTSSSSSSTAPSSGENETKPKVENQDDKSNEDTDIFDVAKTMIGLRNDSGHENHENGQPPSLNAPPALAKRPDNPKLTPADKKRENHHPPSIHQPTMPRLVKKPPIEGAGSLPPMPSLQPKPGLMTHQQTTPVLTTTSQSSGTIPVVQNHTQSAPGTPLKPRISPQTTPVVLPIDPANDPKLVSINPVGGGETGVGTSVVTGGVSAQKRTRSPPFQPVTETSVSPTPNPRASSPYSDISDAGDENPIADKEKDIENKKIGLKSSLTYKANTSLSVNNQFNQTHPVHQRYNEPSYGLSSRDEKKEAKEDLKEAKIVKNEFKTQSESRLPPVSSSHDQNRAKLHSTETKKDRPTATIPPMNSSQSTDRNKNDSKSGPQKQHTPKKDQSPTGKTSLPGVGIPMGLHLPSTFAPAYPQPGAYYGAPPPGFPISQPPGGISGTFYPSNVPYMMNPQGQSKGDYKREKPGSNQERGQSASPQRTATYPYSQPQAPTSFHAGHYPHGASYGHLKK